MINGMDPDELRTLIKQTLQACEGNITSAAIMLGMQRSRLSTMLNHRGLVEWYVPYRERVTLERSRARSRRAYERRRKRQLEQQGLDPDLYFKPRHRHRPVK